MNLKIKKQLPKIVLAQSLACTAILASGIYNSDKVSADEWMEAKRQSLIEEQEHIGSTDGASEVKHEQKKTKAEEWIHACEIWDEKPLSEEERERIKKFFHSMAVGELLQLMQTFHDQRYVLIDKRSIEINEDLYKRGKLNTSVDVSNLDSLKKWVANLDDNTLESLISIYKDGISRVERTKVSHNAAVEKLLKLIQTFRDRGYILEDHDTDSKLTLWLDGKTDISTLDGLKKHLSKFPDALLEELILVYEDEISRAERGEEVKSGKCGANTEWKLEEDGTLTISGTGKVNSNWRGFKTKVTHLVIESGEKDFADAVFFDYDNLKTVDIADGSIRYISDFMFGCCYQLEKVNIGNGVVIIGDHAFFNCFKLKDVLYIPASVEKIELLAFGDCYKLEHVQFRGDKTKIDMAKSAFFGTIYESDRKNYLQDLKMSIQYNLNLRIRVGLKSLKK